MYTLSIIIPVFNEEKRLKKTFEALKSLELPRGFSLEEVIFVNDGSTDTTLYLIKRFASYSKLPIVIKTYQPNAGKGNAVRVGMLASKGDFALLCDADMSTSFEEFYKFLPHINTQAEVILGTRKNGSSTVIVHQPAGRELLGKAFTLGTRLYLNVPITDFTCGFKLFSATAIEKVFSQSKINRWGYDAEIVYLAIHSQLKVTECPVLWSDDRQTHVNLKTAIPQTLWELVKIRYYHTILESFKKIRNLSLSFQHA